MMAIGCGGALAGCTAAVRATTEPRPAGMDSVWYMSMRARDQGTDTRLLADSVEYGVAIFHREASDGTTPDVALTLVDSVTLSARAFRDALRGEVTTGPTSDAMAMLYVHGFGTSLHEAWTFTAQARQLAGSRAPWIAFCWPSNGRGITWPRARALLTRAYQEDSMAAQASRPTFARAVGALAESLDDNTLVMAVHSLGVQLAGESLAFDSTLRTVLERRPLRALAFMVPDVEAERFRDSLLPAFAPITRRQVLYVSSRDRALAIAGQAAGAPRAGQHTNPVLRHPLLETVDITDGVTTEGWFQRAFGTHHAIRRQAGMLFDLTHIVGAGLAASCRADIGTGRLREDGTWALQKGTRPPRDALRPCPPYDPPAR